MKTLKSHSPAQTMCIGETIGRRLKKGDVVALFGQLGSGKTTLTKGICKGLGVRRPEREVSSPTFALAHEYQGRAKVFHLDWYRLEDLNDSDREWIGECFGPEFVTIVEWPERGQAILPKKRIDIRLKGSRLNERTLKVETTRV